MSCRSVRVYYACKHSIRQLNIIFRYTYNNQPDKAIEYNLRLRRPNAFELIQEYNMFDAVKDKAVLLMEFDQHLLEKEENKNKPSKMPAVQLLVKNTDAIPVSDLLLIIHRITSSNLLHFSLKR